MLMLAVGSAGGGPPDLADWTSHPAGRRRCCHPWRLLSLGVPRAMQEVPGERPDALISLVVTLGGGLRRMATFTVVFCALCEILDRPAVDLIGAELSRAVTGTLRLT
ncbi:hypothetical protein GCM10010166_44980 [Couchioplanes caeruleus subsp. azureus]|nr:hypothetical protein GCM10010166_44980 [Couchioplanes caeruleus subsp. azureus]